MAKVFTGKRRNGKSTKLIREFCTFDPNRPETHTNRVLYTMSPISCIHKIQALTGFTYLENQKAFVTPFGNLHIRKAVDIFNDEFRGHRILLYIDEMYHMNIEAIAIESSDAIENFSDEEITEEYLKRTEMWKALK
jgi:hypothetical protein